MLKVIKTSNGIEYNDLVACLQNNKNLSNYKVSDIHKLIVNYQKNNYIHSSKDIDKERSGFITITDIGLIAYFTEVELKQKDDEYKKHTDKQFKITALIALLSAGAVLGQLFFSLFNN